MERKDRKELEEKALQLIASSKMKWEESAKQKLDALNLQIEVKNEKIQELGKTNEMLGEQLQHLTQINENQKVRITLSIMCNL